MPSTAGSRVSAAAIEMIGIITPPTPIDWMNGTGISRSSASPIATVTPEKNTAWPAVRIVSASASSTCPSRLSSSRKR